MLLPQAEVRRLVGPANAVAVGVMAAASFEIVAESREGGDTLTHLLLPAGMLLGAGFSRSSKRWLERFGDLSFADLKGADAQKALLTVGVMCLHTVGEGMGMGVSFSGPKGWYDGLFICTALGIHNIPEGLAVAAVMFARGSSLKNAAFWATIHALPQPLLAVVGYATLSYCQWLMPLAMGFGAGSMLWLALAELVPDALEETGQDSLATIATASAAAMQLIHLASDKLFSADGDGGRVGGGEPAKGRKAGGSGEASFVLPLLGLAGITVAVLALGGGGAGGAAAGRGGGAVGERMAKLLGVATGAAVGLLLTAGVSGVVGAGAGGLLTWEGFSGAAAGLAVALVSGGVGTASLRGPALMAAETSSAPSSPSKKGGGAPEPFGSPKRRNSRALEMPDSPRRMVLLDMPGGFSNHAQGNGAEAPAGANGAAGMAGDGGGSSVARQRARLRGVERDGKNALAWCALFCVVEGFSAAPGVGAGGHRGFFAPLEAGLAGPVWVLGLSLVRAALPGEPLSAMLLAVALLAVQPLAALSVLPGAATPPGPATASLLVFVRHALLAFLAGFTSTRVFARARRLGPREAPAGLLWGLVLVSLYEGLVLFSGLKGFYHPLVLVGKGASGGEAGAFFDALAHPPTGAR